MKIDLKIKQRKHWPVISGQHPFEHGTGMDKYYRNRLRNGTRTGYKSSFPNAGLQNGRIFLPGTSAKR